jgi:hypothetical protein
VQIAGAIGELARIGVHRARDFLDLGLGVRQELVQRRIEQADRDRQAGHDLEQLDEIARCIGSSLASAARRGLLVVGQDHLAHGADAVSSKNMCSVRHRPMPSAPNLRAVRASSACRRWRAPELATASAQPISVPNSPDSSGSIIGTAPASTWPVEPSMVMTSPFLKCARADAHGAAAVIDADACRAGDAGLAHAARHHGGVRGHAAARGQDAFGGVHAVDVFRAGLDAHQDDLARRPAASLGLVGENTISPVAAPGEAGRPVAITSRFGAWDRWSDAASWSSEAGSMRITASFSGDQAFIGQSTAMRSAALAVRLPPRVCSIHSLPCSTVNSMSCMSR